MSSCNFVQMDDEKRESRQSGRFVEDDNSNEVDRPSEGELDVMMDCFYETYKDTVIGILSSKLTVAAKKLELKRFLDSIDYLDSPEEFIRILADTYKKVQVTNEFYFTDEEIFVLSEVFAAKIQKIAMYLQRREWIDQFNQRFYRVIN